MNARKFVPKMRKLKNVSLANSMLLIYQQFATGMGSRQFCRGIGRGRGREVEAEARQGSNILNRGKAERQTARGRGEAD